jgi:hypothetical protein
MMASFLQFNVPKYVHTLRSEGLKGHQGLLARRGPRGVRSQGRRMDGGGLAQ